MSTTVTYKGSTLATVNNQTRTLKTAGKYMEGDIQLVDTTEIKLQSKKVTPSSSQQVVIPDGWTSRFNNTWSSSRTYTVTTSGSSIQYEFSNISVSDSTLFTGIITFTNVGYGTETFVLTNMNLVTYNNNVQKFNMVSSSQSITISVYSGSVKLIIYSPSSMGGTGTISDTHIRIYEQTDEYNGLAEVIVEAADSSSPTIESLTITPSESTQTFNSMSVDGYKPVNVGAISSTYVGSGITRRSSTDLTRNAYTINVPAGYYAENASKAVERTTHATPTVSIDEATGLITAKHTQSQGWVEGSGSGADSTVKTLQLSTQAAKTVTPTESSQTAVAANVYTTGAVTVGAISSTYVGSGITRKSSTDLTVSGATVTTPAGYYAEAASKSVATMTLPTAAASSATSGYTSKATIGRSTAAQYINIPPGYNSTGAYYVISAVANGSATAPASISGTAATKSTGTNTLTLTKTISVTPTVNAGYISSGTATNVSVSLTANVTTMGAQTITPSTSTVSLQAGTYLTGLVSIEGDADLVGSNILSTANIFGVQGTVDFIDVYIRSAAPTSSVGSDGDIYIQE